MAPSGPRMESRVMGTGVNCTLTEARRVGWASPAGSAILDIEMQRALQGRGDPRQHDRILHRPALDHVHDATTDDEVAGMRDVFYVVDLRTGTGHFRLFRIENNVAKRELIRIQFDHGRHR